MSGHKITAGQLFYDISQNIELEPAEKVAALEGEFIALMRQGDQTEHGLAFQMLGYIVEQIQNIPDNASEGAVLRFVYMAFFMGKCQEYGVDDFTAFVAKHAEAMDGAQGFYERIAGTVKTAKMVRTAVETHRVLKR